MLETNVLMMGLNIGDRQVDDLYFMSVGHQQPKNVNKFWQQQCQQTLAPTSGHTHQPWSCCKLKCAGVVQVAIQFDCKKFLKLSGLVIAKSQFKLELDGLIKFFLFL